MSPVLADHLSPSRAGRRLPCVIGILLRRMFARVLSGVLRYNLAMAGEIIAEKSL